MCSAPQPLDLLVSAVLETFVFFIVIKILCGLQTHYYFCYAFVSILYISYTIVNIILMNVLCTFADLVQV